MTEQKYAYNVIRIHEDPIRKECNHPFIKDLMSNYLLYGSRYEIQIQPTFFRINGVDKNFYLELAKNEEGRWKLLIEGNDSEKINNAILGLESKLWRLEKIE